MALCPPGNPAPYFFENGTVLLFYSAQPCPAGWGASATCISVARASSWRGPYSTVGALPITAPESEDPSVFRTARGFHLLTNVNNGHQRCDASVPCGGHAWSRDGLTWSNLTIGSRKIVMLSRVVALSVSLTLTASPLQTDPT